MGFGVAEHELDVELIEEDALHGSEGLQVRVHVDPGRGDDRGRVDVGVLDRRVDDATADSPGPDDARVREAAEAGAREAAAQYSKDKGYTVMAVWCESCKAFHITSGSVVPITLP